jgi:hypothetical protein
VLAGCGTADHDAAVAAVKTFAAAHGESGRVRCTSGVGLPYRLRKPDYLCLVGSGEQCDELRATKAKARWDVRLYRRDVDCVLPA